MNGQPVWLASISRRRASGDVLYVPEWSPAQRREGERLLRQTLDGVGDVTQERLFRMNITLCLHRAASKDEVAQQGPAFLSAPGFGLAGGPVEVLSETVPGAASTKPCAAPRKHVLNSHQYAWIPVDCGTCESCRARAAAKDRTHDGAALPESRTADHVVRAY